MGGLVEDLLLLAELDRGRPLRAEPVDLGRLCADVVEDTDALVHDHLLSLDLGAAPVMVLGDPERVAQVAHNLVRNALAHTPAGTTVTVSVGVEGKAGDAMGFLRVSDSGPGIDSLQAARIFDRFYRGDPARAGAGTGLGLAIVRAIAEALDGSARVEPSPAGGASFVVALPLSPTPASSGPAAPTSTTPAQRVRLPQAH
jgi:two-component system OmpR family sensor kinase